MLESRLHARFPRLAAWLRQRARRAHLVPEVRPYDLAGGDLAGRPLAWAPPPGPPPPLDGPAPTT